MLLLDDRQNELASVARNVAPQKIIQIAQHAVSFPDVIPLWYGESDLPTPPAIRSAAKNALDAGDTFYPDKNGVPALRDALSRYMTDLYRQPIEPSRITVAASGMAALNLAAQCCFGPEDNVIVLAPAWPNLVEIVRLQRSIPRLIMLDFDKTRHWQIDLDRLANAIDDRTRAIIVNTPSNPTGWVADIQTLSAIRDIARRRGLWIIADEVYARIVYDHERAPSFLDVCDRDDRLLVVNSFSKTWCMTGWRLGWLTHPEGIEKNVAELVEYSTAGAAPFVQAAGAFAVGEGIDFVPEMQAYCRTGRSIVEAMLGNLPRVTLSAVDAAFYAFFKVNGETDSLAFAKRLVEEAGVGIAPGIAFGPNSEGWFRLCFARSPATLERAMNRIVAYLT